jgi:hypothetical protein
VAGPRVVASTQYTYLYKFDTSTGVHTLFANKPQPIFGSQKNNDDPTSKRSRRAPRSCIQRSGSALCTRAVCSQVVLVVPPLDPASLPPGLSAGGHSTGRSPQRLSRHTAPRRQARRLARRPSINATVEHRVVGVDARGASSFDGRVLAAGGDRDDPAL